MSGLLRVDDGEEGLDVLGGVVEEGVHIICRGVQGAVGVCVDPCVPGVDGLGLGDVEVVVVAFCDDGVVVFVGGCGVDFVEEAIAAVVNIDDGVTCAESPDGVCALSSSADCGPFVGELEGVASDFLWGAFDESGSDVVDGVPCPV